MKFKDICPLALVGSVVMLFICSVIPEIFQPDKNNNKIKIYTVSYNRDANSIVIVPSTGHEKCAQTAGYSEVSGGVEYAVFECQ